MLEATHKISASYFPSSGEVELTWKYIETGEEIFLTTKCSKEVGEQFVELIGTGAYYDAVVQGKKVEIPELSRTTQIGDRVAWSTIIGDHFVGTLKEWDNWTAIMQMDDGSEKGVST